MTATNFENWDWLPGAAAELEAYFVRLLANRVKPHDVTARAKSIASFEKKRTAKGYPDPDRQITDTVAIRVITYSNTDRDEVADIVRERFVVKSGEDRNPGLDLHRDERRRGYDCWHIIVTGERSADPTGLISGGGLGRYFDEFGGVEVQIRTVAAHAWAEFEHARRYKGRAYGAISDQDQQTIDLLFGAASDARRALDETFDAIDRILARPTANGPTGGVPDDAPRSSTHLDRPVIGSSNRISAVELSDYLAGRFPDEKDGSSGGLEFGVELVAACGYDSVVALDADLRSVKSDEVRALMDYDVPVTRVRRLDDDLLALFKEEYVQLTAEVGSVRSREKQLAWRFDRLRGKTGYLRYSFEGGDCPFELRGELLAAAAAFREAVRVVANSMGAEAVLRVGAVSKNDDLPRGARARPVVLNTHQQLFVAANLRAEASEALTMDLLEDVPMDLRLVKDGQVLRRPPA
jgi:ppGpp synthetase/RelA/SpoT-type nucleotidyltranferase